ncbi:MAG TPA: hypothetical protein PKH93_06820, partial [Chitinophagales bacterium]|nr:hypothetical protein [Chitinophagales bacterium]
MKEHKKKDTLFTGYPPSNHYTQLAGTKVRCFFSSTKFFDIFFLFFFIFFQNRSVFVGFKGFLVFSPVFVFVFACFFRNAT